ncbi:hypothetical protein ACJQWK_02516 [Exserohilum turcicum]
MSPPIFAGVTERSQKFYNGTYTWDSDGFTDDTGVHRYFDCYDPVARAPTPLPPMGLAGDDKGEVQDQSGTLSVNHDKFGATKSFTFALDGGSKRGTVTVQCHELFRDRADREHLIGKMEGVLVASKAHNVDLTLEECYQLCGIPYSDTRVGKALPENITPPSSPSNNKCTESKLWSPSSLSELSSCPSDLSEWDVAQAPKNQATATKIAPQELPLKVEKPKPKPGTRGIAQKVKNGVKKPAASTATARRRPT